MEAPAVRAPLGIFLKLLIGTAEKVLQLGEATMTAEVGDGGRALLLMSDPLGCRLLQKCQVHFSPKTQVTPQLICIYMPCIIYTKTCVLKYITCLGYISPSWNHRACGFSQLKAPVHGCMYVCYYYRSIENRRCCASATMTPSTGLSLSIYIAV